MLKKINSLKAAFIIISFTMVVTEAIAQDARVSQYNSIPLLVNPSQTGDFDGKLRVLGLAARVNNRTAHNYFFNASADFHLGTKEDWGIGLNYMQSGAEKFPINGQYFGASIGKRFHLDHADLQTLRVGVQASWLTGGVDVSKSGYDRFLDVNAFRYLDKPLSATINGTRANTSYLNYSVGAKYKIEFGRLKVETGLSAYNITNPNHNISYEGVNTLLKRYRVTALNTLHYQFSNKDAIRVEHYSWKEGIFLRDYKPKRDTVGIHETTYSLTWLRKVKNSTISLGAYSRSWQSIYGVASANLSDRIGISASYEFPILKTYYDVAHVELGFAFYPFRKKILAKNQNEQFSKQILGLLPYGISLCPPCDSVKVKRTTATGAPDPATPFNTNKGQAVLFSDTIYYDLDKYYIRPDAQVKLNQISRLMKRLDLTLEVKSHTDLRANASYNNKLSERRAESVKNYLTATGLDSSKIEISWFGKNDPIYNCSTCIDSLQEINRRSVLVLKGFNELNLQKIINERLLGAEINNKEQLALKIKQLLILEGGMEASFSSGLSGTTSENRYYTIKVATRPAQKETFAIDLRWLNIFSEKSQDGVRKYFYGMFLNKGQAEKALQKLQQLGIKEASIKEVGLFLN